MPKRRVALIAAIAIALVGLPFAFLARPSPRFELHFLRAARVAESVNVFFEIRNEPPNSTVVHVPSLEVFDGAAWKEIKYGSSFHQFKTPTNLMFCCVIDRQMPAARFRLVIQSERRLNALENFIARVKMRLSGKHKVELNPFTKNVVLWEPETSSVEFALP
jgi:hypothetical protein